MERHHAANAQLSKYQSLSSNIIMDDDTSTVSSVPSSDVMIFQSLLCEELQQSQAGLQSYLVRLYLESQKASPAGAKEGETVSSSSAIPRPALTSDVAEHLKGLVKVQVEKKTHTHK